jgi:pantetheine-phosphate adenylyltransferase
MRAAKAKRVGVYAGSFDPLTVGHLWMIRQGVLLFDRLIVGLGTNPEKSYTFTTEERMRLLRDSLKSFKNISVASFSNRYLIEFAQSVGATHVLRGIRSESDYEYERTMRYINGDLDGAICTVFLMPPRDIAEVSSSMVKSLVGPQGWKKVVRKYVPEPVYHCLLGLQGDRPGLLSPVGDLQPTPAPTGSRRSSRDLIRGQS